MASKTESLVTELRRYARASSLPEYLRLILRQAADVIEASGKEEDTC